MNAGRVARRPVAAAFVAAVVAALVLDVRYAPGSLQVPFTDAATYTVFAVVGFLLSARLPRHPIGWIYMLGSLGAAVASLASSIGTADRATPAAMPGATGAAWLHAVLSGTSLVVMTVFPLLLFPDGKLLSRRWRPVLWIAVAGVACIASYPAFTPGHLGGDAKSPINPIGIRGSKELLQGLNGAGLFAVGFTAVAAIVSLFVRFRRASGAEREQLKWLAWAGVWTIVLLFTSGPGIYGGTLPAIVRKILAPVVVQLFGLALVLIPLAITVAVLRYHLWSIDRVISRTVSYLAITAVLGAVWATLVLVPSVLIDRAGNTPDYLVAVATLVVAALFRPVRGRLQRTLEHRFNRSRYDASAAVDLFVTRLRNEIDIDTLAADLQTLVHHTMEPSQVSLWIKP